MRTDARPAFRLNLLELEGRDVPASWFSVTAPTPAEGTVGVTDAVHTGELTLNPAYPIENGAVKVFAADPVEAAALALVGTIHVELGGVSADYVFGPATVGSAAEFQPFTLTATGSAVSIGLEDMAGLPGAAPDWDRNDRMFTAVTASAQNGGVVTFEGTMQDTSGQTAKVTTTVTLGTDAHPNLYKWNYHVQNTSFDQTRTPIDGIGHFVVQVPARDQVQMMGSSVSWPGYADGTWISQIDTDVYWNAPGSGLLPGAAADFYFSTVPLPIVATTAEMWNPDVASGGTGPAKAPAVPKADIDIVGKIRVGDAKNGVETVFSEANEDTIGGLVVRRVDDNNAPRQQISVEKLKDAANVEVVGGKVEVTTQGGVELYDAAAGGKKVASKTVYDNANLPVQLWVQGVAGSGKMRDVKITATPVGAGESDDVSFTVLWVDVSVNTDPTKTVSANNDKKDTYFNGTLDKNGIRTLNLGPNRYVPPLGNGIAWGVEGKGSVSPSDFDYPGSDLRLTQDWEYGFYATGRPDQTSPFAADNPKPAYRDDNLLDSAGNIYMLDNPGIDFPGQGKPQGFIYRFRANLKTTASITINGATVRAGNIFEWFVRLSIRQNGAGVAGQWALIDPADVNGDNQAGPGRSKLSANLQ